MNRILVVDDHAIVRAGICRLLQDREDTEVLQAASGEEALDVAQGAVLNLIVLDLNLPALGVVSYRAARKHAAPASSSVSSPSANRSAICPPAYARGYERSPAPSVHRVFGSSK